MGSGCYGLSACASANVRTPVSKRTLSEGVEFQEARIMLTLQSEDNGTACISYLVYRP